MAKQQGRPDPRRTDQKRAEQKRADQKKVAQARRDQRRAKSERAKAAAAEARRRARRKERLTYVLVAVVALALAVGGFFAIRALNDTSETATPPEGASELGVVVGEADAEHEVVIYEDFLCPPCANLEAALGQPLSTAVDDGRVRVEYRALDFLSQSGDYSLRSANAFAAVLDTAGPEAALEFHDALFAEQPAESGPYPDDDALVEQAVAAGAPEDQVRPLIEDLGFEGWIADSTEDASSQGVRSTPTVYVDGEQATGETTDEVVSAVLAAIQ